MIVKICISSLFNKKCVYRKDTKKARHCTASFVYIFMVLRCKYVALDFNNEGK